jgi:hypothetical protein
MSTQIRLNLMFGKRFVFGPNFTMHGSINNIKTNGDPQPWKMNIEQCSEYASFLEAGSGSASKWKAGSGSASK